MPLESARGAVLASSSSSPVDSTASTVFRYTWGDAPEVDHTTGLSP